MSAEYEDFGGQEQTPQAEATSAYYQTLEQQEEAVAPENGKPVLVLSELKRSNAEAVGLRCPKCGCRHLVVETTRQQFDEAKRYRVCRNCGTRVRTFERIG